MTKRSMKGWLLCFCIGIFLGLQAQEPPKAIIPQNVQASLEGLNKTKTANGVFQIQYLYSHFWAMQDSVYVNILFAANLDSDAQQLRAQLKAKYDEYVAQETKNVEEFNKKVKKEADKKKFEPQLLEYPKIYHNLFLRVMADGKQVQEFKAPIPWDDDKTEYYSFSLILNPGQYEVQVDINRFDNTHDGTQIFNVAVPALTVAEIIKPRKKLEFSLPVFYQQFSNTEQREEKFTVFKNQCVILNAGNIFSPYVGGPVFSAKDTPILSFFVLGALPGSQGFQIAVTMEMKQGKQSIVKFADIKMDNVFFFQPLVFKKTEKNQTVLLAPGDYTLVLDFVDKNSKAKGEMEIPLKLTE